jgi:hypothetical protein
MEETMAEDIGKTIPVEIRKPRATVDGVKPAAANKVYEMLTKGRRYFGSSGAFTTNMAHNPEYQNREDIDSTIAAEYLAAERDMTRFLKNWMQDKPNVVLIDSVLVPGAEDNTEPDSESRLIEGRSNSHILIMGDEVVVIDTKRWKTKKNYAVSDEGEALMTNKPFPYSRLTISDTTDSWLDTLHAENPLISSIVCLHQEEVTVFRNKNWFTADFRLVEKDRMEEFMERKWSEVEEHSRSYISSSMVAQVATRCAKPYDEFARVFAMDTLKKMTKR